MLFYAAEHAYDKGAITAATAVAAVVAATVATTLNIHTYTYVRASLSSARFATSSNGI